MSRALRVLLLTPQGSAAPVGSGGDIDCHVCPDLSDLLGRAAAGGADLVAVSPQAAGVDASVIARIRSIGCRVAAVTQTAHDVDLARRVGLANSLALPLDPTAVRTVLDAPDDPATEAQPAAGSGRVVAVWGPPGSPGRTTVSALLAAGARRAGREVVVVDAHLDAPAWCLLTERPITASGLLVASRRAATGAPDTSDLLVEFAPGLRGLLLAAQPERWTEVAPAALSPVLSRLAESADLVVVDVGADIRAAHPAYDIGWAHDAGAVARAVLEAADVVTAVVGADPAGVHRFATWWPILSKQADPAVIVANRMGVPRAGKKPARQVESVIAALGATGECVQVPWEPKAADGLLQPNWWHARGWGKVPEALLSSVEAALSVRRAAGPAPLRASA